MRIYSDLGTAIPFLRPRQVNERPPNGSPFSGLGAAEPARRFYADASAATRSAATACSTATRGEALVALVLWTAILLAPCLTCLIRRKRPERVLLQDGVIDEVRTSKLVLDMK